jgi:UDP-glucose 4-epimerase
VGNGVEANLAAAEAPGVSGQVINIGGGQRFSILDIVRELEGVFGRALPIRYTSGPPGVRDTLADISWASALLDYRPAIDFREGLRRTAAVTPRARVRLAG